MITKLAKEQKELIMVAFENLKPGGEMVYSTCSVDPEENEGVVSYLLKKYENAKAIKVTLKGLKTSPIIMEFDKEQYHPDVKHALRIWYRRIMIPKVFSLQSYEKYPRTKRSEVT